MPVLVKYIGFKIRIRLGCLGVGAFQSNDLPLFADIHRPRLLSVQKYTAIGALERRYLPPRPALLPKDIPQLPPRLLRGHGESVSHLP